MMILSGVFSLSVDQAPELEKMLLRIATKTRNHKVKLAKFFIMFQNFQSGASR
ncbi:MAG: hypothetical protein WCJ39_00415 [bacterium]